MNSCSSLDHSVGGGRAASGHFRGRAALAVLSVDNNSSFVGNSIRQIAGAGHLFKILCT